ncbi:MAG: radical SAM protein, partial [Chloroflexi bacterium]|nr:radical SAM protein [Chloroflexota bacterium]
QEKTAAAGRTLDAVILSNGVAIGEREIAALQERDIRITISLDGICEAHDAQRRFVNGQGSFAWVDRSIERLLAHSIKPFITITVSNRNAAQLPDVVRYVLARELPFNLNFYRENNCSAAFADLQMQDDRLIEALHQAFDVIEANLPQHSLLGSLVDRAQFDRPHNKPCGVNESYMVIDHHGRVAQCHMEIEKTVTTVFTENPLDMLKSDTIHLQNISVEEKEGCRACEWRYWCAGGCPLLTYRATSRYDVKSPYCRVYKAIYPRLLRLEGLRLLKLHQEAQGGPV